MPSRGSQAPIRADLSRSLWDGVLFSSMVGLGETYLPAFALALGHGQVLAGLVASVPMMIGATLQLVTPYGVQRLGSNRRWVTRCALVQALVFLPLALCAALGSLPALGLFAAAAVYWASGLAAGPAWTSWVPGLVPRRLRSRYFAYRTRASQAAVLAALLSGGAVLELTQARGAALQGFALIFLLASLFRLSSTRLLALQSEPRSLPAGFRALPLSKAFAGLARGAHARLFVFLLALQVSVQVAAPYFTPYMLGHLQLGYAPYVALVATAYLARAAALPFWGSLAHRIGSQRLLWIGAIGIAPAALPWVLTDSVGILLLAQVAAGCMWGAYELATFLVLFDRLDDSERTSLLAAYNLANALAVGTGSLLGALLLGRLGHDALGYTALFSVTTGLRLLAMLMLPRGSPRATPLPLEPLGTRTIAVRPSLGAIERPILPPGPPEAA